MQRPMQQKRERKKDIKVQFVVASLIYQRPLVGLHPSTG